MKKDEIINVVKNHLLTYTMPPNVHQPLNNKTFDLSLNFKDDLAFDSIDVFEYLIEVEQIFKIFIPHEESKDIKTISDMIDKIEKYLLIESK